MNHITTVTEKTINKMVKENHKFGQELQYLLDQIKSTIGYYGADIKEITQHGYQLDNAIEIQCYISDTLRGIGALHQSLITVVNTHDLSYCNIKDFNKLVQECNVNP